MASRLSPEEVEIKRSVQWLKERRRHTQAQVWGLSSKLTYFGSDDPAFDRMRLTEAQERLRQFDVLIGQHTAKLAEYRQARKISQNARSQSYEIDSEPHICAVPESGRSYSQIRRSDAYIY